MHIVEDYKSFVCCDGHHWSQGFSVMLSLYIVCWLGFKVLHVCNLDK